MARLFPRLLLRRYCSKRLILCITAVILVDCILYIIYEQKFAKFTKGKSVTQSPLYSINERNTIQLNGKYTRQAGERKVLLTFSYMEHLTLATNNLLQLTALAAFGGRQVVVPFVSDSFFYGTATDKINQTLAFYYNITALNNTLRSHGHATMISWKEFQGICKGRLDVLVHLDYTALSKTTTYSVARPFIPCKGDEKMIQGIEIGNSICLNVFALDSSERFENEVVKKLPCVGFLTWVGTDRNNPYRAQFDLNSVVSKVLSPLDVSAFFNSKFLDVAQDFIAKTLPPRFISVHIRLELLLRNGGNVTLVKKCISDLTAQVLKIMTASKPVPVFIAMDFLDFASKLVASAGTKPEIALSLMKILSPLNIITFRPSEYKFSDRGAVAIVEMNILASGKYLIVLGGGSYQFWIERQFLEKNGNDRSKVNRIPCK